VAESNLEAYLNGARFYVEGAGFVNSRGQADRVRKKLQTAGQTVKLYYVLPSGELKLCAKGRRKRS